MYICKLIFWVTIAVRYYWRHILSRQRATKAVQVRRHRSDRRRHPRPLPDGKLPNREKINGSTVTVITALLAAWARWDPTWLASSTTARTSGSYQSLAGDRSEPS
jgi:hypothetical protein